MLISSSSRYSIYKVQSCSRLPLGSLELLYLSTLKPLCQELFSSFFKLFCSRSSFSVARNRLSDSGVSISDHFEFVKTFFIFFKLFSTAYLTFCFCCGFLILAQLSSLVKNFLSLLTTNSSRLYLVIQLSRALHSR